MWNEDFFKMSPEALLCHGYVRSTIASDYFITHAWCEVEGLVYDLTTPEYEQTIRDEYYVIRDPHRYYLRRYTLEEASKLASETGTYGPWDPVFHDIGRAIVPERLRNEAAEKFGTAYTLIKDIESKLEPGCCWEMHE